MQINTQELRGLLQEAGELSNKTNWTKQDERRHAYLLSAISAVKSGVSLADVNHDYLNTEEQRMGLELTKRNPFLNREQESEARSWQKNIGREQRDMTAGSIIPRIGTYTGLGEFVPTEFFPALFRALAWYDVLFDADTCTVIKTDNGRPITVPVAGDVENVATVLAESASRTSVDISSLGHSVLGAYSYSTPRLVVSIESFDDLDSTLNVVNLFKTFSADRLARGIGKDLVNGDGANKPLGLIPSLLAAGINPIAAQGSAANDGSANTGANSLGSLDFQAAYAALDEAYVASPKCAWLMSKKTLANVAGIVHKFGDQLNLVKYVDGKPFIYGIPVKIAPSMDSIGASKTPVVLGDFSYWATRLVIDDAHVQVFKEGPNLVEQGNIGLVTFARADGELLYTDTNSPSPFVMVRNHS